MFVSVASRVFPTLFVCLGLLVAASPGWAATPEETAKTLIEQAKTLEKNKDAAKALAAFDEAVKAAPQYAEGFYQRGLFHERQKDHAKAIADYDQALEL